MSDVPDQISPITVITPIGRLWALWLRLSWKVADRSSLVKGRLLDLGFIHVAHWGLAPRRARAKPRLLFQSNYDGPAEEYAEAFAFEVPGRVRGMWGGRWGGAEGFPGPHPPSVFVHYVLERAVPQTSHYYAAYLGASVRTVRAALAVHASLDEFIVQSADMGPDEFAAAWQRFLTEQQGNL